MKALSDALEKILGLGTASPQNKKFVVACLRAIMAVGCVQLSHTCASMCRTRQITFLPSTNTNPHYFGAELYPYATNNTRREPRNKSKMREFGDIERVVRAMNSKCVRER